MDVINWLAVRPTDSDLRRAAEALEGVAHIRVLLQAVVRAILQGHPWRGRTDVVPVFDPSRKYEAGQFAAVPIRDPQHLRPDTWRIARVKTVADAANPVQGAFQVVTLRVEERDRIYAAGVAGTHPLPLAFPPADDDALAWLVADIVDAYSESLIAAVRSAIDQGRLRCRIKGNQVMCIEAAPAFGDEEARLVADAFAEISDRAVPYLTTDEILAALRKGGCWSDVRDETARTALEEHLPKHNYGSIGGNRWMTSQALASAERDVIRRPKVPVIRSKVAEEMGLDDAPDFDDYRTVTLIDAEAMTALEALGEPEPQKSVLRAWHPPSAPIPLAALTYQQIVEGFFPLGKALSSAFPPEPDPLLADIVVANGDPIACWVSRKEGLMKAVDMEEFRQRFLDLGIPAGTKLWLEYRGGSPYRIAPRPLAHSTTIKCKIADWDANGRLFFTTESVPVSFEHEPLLFMAELRHLDREALFTEAEEKGHSVFDAMFHAFGELAVLSPDGRVHRSELFNAVFFRYRMCSPRSVVTELYDRPCFVSVGGGWFCFDEKQGIHRKSTPGKKKTGPRGGKRPDQAMPPVGLPEVPEPGLGPEPCVETPALPTPGPEPESHVEKPAPPTTEPEPGVEKPAQPAQKPEQVSSVDEPEPPPPRPQPLKFPGFWGEIASLEGRTLRTLDLGHPFAVVSVTEAAASIQVRGTGEKRTIPRKEIEGAWGRLVSAGELSRAAIGAFHSKFNTAYVAAILAALPGVKHKTDPIHLFYRKGDVVSQPPPTGQPQPQTPIVEATPPTTGPDPIWTRVSQLAGRELVALRSKQSFRITKIADGALHFTIRDSGKTGRVKRSDIERAWRHLQKQGNITKGEILKHCSESDACFLGAILVALAQGQVVYPPDKAIAGERTRKGQFVMTEVVPPGPLFDQPAGPAPEPQAAEPVADQAGPPAEPPAPALPRVAPVRAARPPSAKRDEMQAKTLFSTHYLDNRLPQLPEWADDPLAAFQAIRAQWQKAREYGSHWLEAATEDEFVKPALLSLGWAYVPQPRSQRHGGRVTRPDYALFADEAAKNAAYQYHGQDDAFYSRALAIAEAKYWERPLSQKEGERRDTWKEGNPSHQMVSYLVGTRAPWGILTNGRVWRLYSREVSSTASEYYEIDLGNIFDAVDADAEPTDEQLDAFRRWWLFFRRDALLPDAQGKSFVQRVHEGSATYAREISDKLKDLVFRDVMPEIAGGFVAFRYHQLGIREETDESLREIYQASLSLLYKLLFLLYAEARSLLPVNEPGYREQSLNTMARWAADCADRKLTLSDATHAAPKYGALLDLFSRIDQGDPSLGIPRYNGGLFNPKSADNLFLASHKLSDRAVAKAVDILVRDAGQPVDYAYISVRNLGAIYEGLLENKLHLSPLAAGEGPGVRVELVNDKGERKASGSYYTPDYIVEYIVQHTLDPILEERDTAFRAAMDGIAGARRKLSKAMDAKANELLHQQLADAERDAREAFLGIKVLDPAMGSGHFLVNAVDHLTDGIIQRMQAYHDEHPGVLWEWNPIQQLIESVRSEILEEMKRQRIPLDAKRLDDTAILTRLVMKRCIYGVDLNPMAVELAKLSLWLHSFTVGAPLSFLDHHLRWGNSLIGTDVRTVQREIQVSGKGRAQQFGLFGGPFAGLLDLTAMMMDVAERADATLADVRQSAETFEEFQKQLTPYKQALDLWVSQHFDNKPAYEFLTVYGDDVLPALRDGKKVAPQYEQAIARALELWKEKRFFHWDLEFPEAFVDLRKRDWAENPGFDVVIGNPPYSLGRDWGAVPDKTFYAGAYQAAQYQIDLYQLFMERALRTVRANGLSSYIVPDSWTTAVYSEKLRELLLTETQIIDIVILPSGVFPEATVDTIIYIVRHRIPDVDHSVRVSELVALSARYTPLHLANQSRFLHLPGKKLTFWVSPTISNLLTRIDASSVCITDVCETTRGINAYDRSRGQSEDLIRSRAYHADHRVDASYSPELMGEDIGRFENKWNGEHWIKYGDWLAAPRESRFFTQPKLLVRKLLSNERIVAHVDSESYYVDQQLYIGVRKASNQYSLAYLCTLCNSSLISFAFVQRNRETAVSFPQVTVASFEQFPMRRISFTMLPERRAALAEDAKRLYEAYLDSGNPAPVLAFVSERLAAQPEESDVVHDLLAHLAEQMIHLNKQKQAEMKGFLAWLERETGAPVDDLTGKSKVKGYLGDYQKGEEPLPLQELLEILRKNARRLKADPSARAFQEALKREYEGSLARLLPIKSSLAATDRLIDLIVYRLYGLTDEEIAIVEGRAT